MTSALAANLAYLYMLPLCTFFSSLYHNVVIQSTLLQYCDIYCSLTLILKIWIKGLKIQKLAYIFIFLLVLSLLVHYFFKICLKILSLRSNWL